MAGTGTTPTPSPTPRGTMLPQFGNQINLGNMGMYKPTPTNQAIPNQMPMFGNNFQFPTIQAEPTLQPFGTDINSLIQSRRR